MSDPHCATNGDWDYEPWPDAMDDPTLGPCPVCGAREGVACTTPIDGVDTGWTHDARILAPIIADLSFSRDGDGD